MNEICRCIFMEFGNNNIKKYLYRKKDMILFLFKSTSQYAIDTTSVGVLPQS